MLSVLSRSKPGRLRLSFFGFVLVLLGGCSAPDGEPANLPADLPIDSISEGAPTPGVSTPDAAPEGSGPKESAPLVVFLGDSLTAGYGLGAEQAFPALIEQRLRELGQPTRVVNAGVSGDTSAGGLARLDWLLAQEPDLLVVCLGGNDGLRGLEIAQLEANLRAIVERGRERGAQLMLMEMRIPPSYGEDYVAAFEGLYPRLATELELPLIPFLLDGVAGVEELLLPDGLHPNAAGQERVAENVLPHLLQLLEDSTAPATTAPRGS